MCTYSGRPGSCVYSNNQRVCSISASWPVLHQALFLLPPPPLSFSLFVPSQNKSDTSETENKKKKPFRYGFDLSFHVCFTSIPVRASKLVWCGSVWRKMRSRLAVICLVRTGSCRRSSFHWELDEWWWELLKKIKMGRAASKKSYRFLCICL